MSRSLPGLGRIALLSLGLASCAGCRDTPERASGRGADPALREEVAQAVRSARDYLVEALAKGDYRYGLAGEALAGLALVQSGTPPSDPALRRIWADLEADRRYHDGSAPWHGTYHRAIMLLFADAMMHAPCGEPWPPEGERDAVRAWMGRQVDALAATCVGGTWGWDAQCIEGQPPDYAAIRGARLGGAALLKAVEEKDYAFTDYSNTQYAALGLKAAELNGVRFKDGEALWNLILQQALWRQEPWGPEVRLRAVTEDGSDAGEQVFPARARGWGYEGQRSVSMRAITLGGLTSLLVARSAAKLSDAEDALVADAIRDGLAWVQEHWELDPPGPYYYLCVQHLGMLGNLRALGGHAWYDEGARRLLRAQGQDFSSDRNVWLLKTCLDAEKRVHRLETEKAATLDDLGDRRAGRQELERTRRDLARMALDLERIEGRPAVSPVAWHGLNYMGLLGPEGDPGPCVDTACGLLFLCRGTRAAYGRRLTGPGGS